MNNQTDAEQDRDWLQRSNDELRAQNAELLAALEAVLGSRVGTRSQKAAQLANARQQARNVISKAKSR